MVTIALKLVTVLAIGMAAPSGGLTVVGVEPAAHSIGSAVDAPIVVHFDKPIVRESIVPLRSFWAFGRWSGTVAGTFGFSDADRTVTLTPDFPLSAGETVMVILSHDIRATDGTTLRAGGYSFQFWTRTIVGNLTFAPRGELSTQSPLGAGTRAYGGIASDLNGDRFLDVTIINEDTADLRVFLNRATGAVAFDSFLTPTFPVGPRASPNEPTDFNRDGIVDICVANINENTVSVLLGNGDGTFAPQQKITVGGAPRGIAVLDVDGDGDMDIVNTNASSGNLSLLLNDGGGVFSTPTFFDGGGAEEWALAAGDMNDDGLLDLVIGDNGTFQSPGQMLVHVGNGNATFTHVSTQASDGAVWMIVLGDVDGNGTEDVAGVNSGNNRAAILFGDGAGGLAAPQRYNTDPFPIATDLGDLDGDGDLDWVTSSFSGDWFLFVNDGAGQFSFRQRFQPPQKASCALMMDADNDGDLDLALIDEVADVVRLQENIAPPPPPIPTVSDYGLVVMMGLLVAVGAAILDRRRRTVGDTRSPSSQ